MLIEWVLVSLVASSQNQVTTTFINKFTTSTACEQAARSLAQGNVSTGQGRQFVCVKYDASK